VLRKHGATQARFAIYLCWGISPFYQSPPLSRPLSMRIALVFDGLHDEKPLDMSAPNVASLFKKALAARSSLSEALFPERQQRPSPPANLTPSLSAVHSSPIPTCQNVSGRAVR